MGAGHRGGPGKATQTRKKRAAAKRLLPRVKPENEVDPAQRNLGHYTNLSDVLSEVLALWDRECAMEASAPSQEAAGAWGGCLAGRVSCALPWRTRAVSWHGIR